MAGHSKWSQIKRKKAKIDAQKGKAFTKVVREIIMAVKMGGGPDPDANSRLRLALQKAKEVNMPADNIKRAIQKGEGSDSDQIEEATFEAYGPHGVGIIIKTLTDNRNRTVPNLRAILGKNGGNMANNGAVSYMFDLKSLFVFEPGASEENVMNVALEVGADDIDTQEDGSIEVVLPPENYHKALDAFDKAELPYETGILTEIPQTTVELTAEQGNEIDDLIEKLEEDDDVQDVYSNHIY